MKTTLIACFTLIVTAVHSQKKLPSFGKADLAEMQMTECSFEKGADAVKLIDYGKLTFDRGTENITEFKTVYNRRVRIKILKEKGVKYANVEIPFYNSNNEESIINIDATTINLDANGKIKSTDVPKSSIYIKKINRQYSRLIIAFPEAKAGSIIEYRYTLQRDIYTELKDWEFQDEIPTRYSEYEVNLPTIFKYNVNPIITDSLDYKEKQITDVITMGRDAVEFKMIRQTFIMQQLPGIRDEIYTSTPKDYIQRLEFQLAEVTNGNGGYTNYSASWAGIVKRLKGYEDFGKQLDNVPSAADPLIQQALKLSSKEERLKLIFTELKNRIAITDNEAVYTDLGIYKSWHEKTGNAADANLLLVALLNKAGLKASPILMSTRSNGLINSGYTSLNQFNVVMAFVNVDDESYVLDVTDKVSYFKLTPERVVNTRGFIVEGVSGRFHDVIDNKHKYQVVVAIKGSIDANGVMTGEGTVNSINYAKRQRVIRHATDPDEFRKNYFITPNPSLTISTITVSNHNVDSLPLLQKVQFTTPLNNSGEYSYFTPNMFTEFTTNPFTDNIRRTDIDFGYQKEYAIYGQYTIPDGYVYETLPKNISVSMGNRSLQYSRTMDVKDNVLMSRITVDFKRPFYLISDYTVFQEFYKKMLAVLDEQVVIKKKN